jgi:hypothetical protein
VWPFPWTEALQQELTGRSMALPEQQRFGNIAVLQHGVLRNIVAKILLKTGNENTAITGP